MRKVNCWLAQYIADPVRQEPKNIGVFAEIDGKMRALFFGQELGEPLEKFSPPKRNPYGINSLKIYKHWFIYWHKVLESNGIESLIQTSKSNFRVVDNGLFMIDAKSTEDEILLYLYDLLVADADTRRKNAKKASKPLRKEVKSLFADAGLLEADLANNIIYPIEVDRELYGEGNVAYHPTFAQENGALRLIEPFDLRSTSQLKRTRDRAGYAAHMLEHVGRVWPAETKGLALIMGKDSENFQQPTAQESLNILERDYDLIWLDEPEQREEFLEGCLNAARGMH